MDRVPSRLISAFAALPISFVLIPYAIRRRGQTPWYNVLIRPLSMIFIAWAVALFAPVGLLWLPSLAVIIWQSSSLRTRVDEARLRPQPQREAWHH